MTRTKSKYGLFTNKALFYLIVPIVIESALSMSMGFIDGIMVTHAASEAFLAVDPNAGDHFVTAITDVDQISSLLIQLFAAFVVGGAVITSQHLGAGRTDDANRSAKQLVVIMLLSALGISALCLGLNPYIISLFFGNLDSHTHGYAVTYFYITACSFPFLAVFNSCAALLRAQRKSMNTMLSGIISFFLNIGFNALFIFALKLGIAGVGLGTLLARVFPACFTLFLMTRKTNVVRIRIFEKFRFDGGQLKKILKLGVPSGIENCFFQLGKILVLVFIQAEIYNVFVGVNADGTEIYTNFQASANSVAYNVNTISSMVGSGINTAVLTVIGQAVGAGDIGQIKYYIKKMLLISYVCNGVCVAATFGVAPFLLNSYNISEEARAVAWNCLIICLSFQFFTYPLSFGMPAVLKASSDVKYVMVVAVVSMVLMRVGLCYILTCDWAGARLGAIGLWIGMVSDWIVRSAFFGGRVLSGKWKKSAGLITAPAGEGVCLQTCGEAAVADGAEESGNIPLTAEYCAVSEDIAENAEEETEQSEHTESGEGDVN